MVTVLPIEGPDTDFSTSVVRELHPTLGSAGIGGRGSPASMIKLADVTITIAAIRFFVRGAAAGSTGGASRSMTVTAASYRLQP